MEQRIWEMEQSRDVHKDELNFARQKLHTARLIEQLKNIIDQYESAITSNDKHSIQITESKIKDFYIKELKDYNTSNSDLTSLIQNLKKLNLSLE